MKSPRFPNERAALGLLSGALFALATLAPVALAQSSAPPPAVGSRVRVTVAAADANLGYGLVNIGNLVQITNERVVISASGGARTEIPVPAVTRLESSTLHRRWAAGLLIGGLGGAAVGALVAYAADPGPCDFICFSGGERALIGGVAGGVSGGLVGVLIGAGVRSERWVPARLTVTGPAQSGLGVTASWTLR